MPLRSRIGELVLGLVFIGAGLFWVHQALQMRQWDGFAPGSGLLPLIYGILLVALAAVAVAVDLITDRESDEAKEPVQKPLLVLLATAAGVLGIEFAGFAVSVFLAALFLYAVIERHALVPAVLASIGTAGVLTVVFRNWLGVPLPSGPWGF